MNQVYSAGLLLPGREAGAGERRSKQGFMLRRRRSRALQVARLLIHIERAAAQARPWEPERRTRLSLAGRG
jgi:hypothetical protein